MSKRIIGLLLCALLFLSGCAAENENRTEQIVGSDEKITSRMENIAELQKNVFECTVQSIKTENALITKYNLDITTYTVYTVDITNIIDGFTPTGQAKLYCVGTTEQFHSRINLIKGEQYIIDAQPWVYGDEIIYLLSVYTVAYPRVDTAGMVTLAKNDSEAVSCGTLTDYLAQYETAKQSLAQRDGQFFNAQNILSRFGQTIAEIKEKNCDTSVYSSENGYEWVPEQSFIEKTAKTSSELFEKFNNAAGEDCQTPEQAYKLITSVLG